MPLKFLVILYRTPDECHYRIALSLYHLGEIETAKEHLQTALRLNEKRDPNKEIEGPLESHEEIIRETEILYDRLTETKEQPISMPVD